MDAQTSPSLLLRLRSSEDQEAWDRFGRIYLRLIFSWCHKCGLNHNDAKDCAQEVMIDVLKDIKHFEHRGPGSFRGWLRRVIRNNVIDFNSKRSAESLPNDEMEKLLLTNLGPQWNEEYPVKVYQSAFDAIRNRFTLQTLRAFELTQFDGLSIEDTSTAMGISPNAVYVARFRVASVLVPMMLELMD